jgi:hypothetical protein
MQLVCRSGAYMLAAGRDQTDSSGLCSSLDAMPDAAQAIALPSSAWAVGGKPLAGLDPPWIVPYGVS